MSKKVGLQEAEARCYKKRNAVLLAKLIFENLELRANESLKHIKNTHWEWSLWLLCVSSSYFGLSGAPAARVLKRLVVCMPFVVVLVTCIRSLQLLGDWCYEIFERKDSCLVAMIAYYLTLN